MLSSFPLAGAGSGGRGRGSTKSPSGAEPRVERIATVSSGRVLGPFLKRPVWHGCFFFAGGEVLGCCFQAAALPSGSKQSLGARCWIAGPKFGWIGRDRAVESGRRLSHAQGQLAGFVRGKWKGIVIVVVARWVPELVGEHTVGDSL